MNQNGFTFLTALFMVMMIGVMLGLTGQSWKMIMQREREKELLFRGSQIKEAIENWYNPKYTTPGVPPRAAPHALMDLKDLLKDPYSLTSMRYLPHNYGTELDGKNSRCAPDCPKLKVYEDPMTGKEWTLIRGNLGAGGIPATGSNAQGAGIIGVASKSDDQPFRTNFKDTGLENIATAGVGAATGGVNPTTPNSSTISAPGVTPGTTPGAVPGAGGTVAGGSVTKYSEWKFVAETPQKNDHSKIYRSYHEGW